MRPAAFFALVLTGLITQASPAAEPSERLQALHRAARNQLGVLEYCAGRGLADDSAVAAQRRTVGGLPPLAVAHVGDQEEAEGRLGYLAFDGRQAALADSAGAQGITLATACAGRAASALTTR